MLGGSKETNHCLIFLFSSKLTRIIKNVCGQLRMHYMFAFMCLSTHLIY